MFSAAGCFSVNSHSQLNTSTNTTKPPRYKTVESHSGIGRKFTAPIAVMNKDNDNPGRKDKP